MLKTSDGAYWAAAQAAELVKLGIEVHVALPRAEGRAVEKWCEAGVTMHVAPTDLQVRELGSIPETMHRLRSLVSSVDPDIIHTHFVSSTLLLRLALGANHPVPRLFQVPGPLHLEHGFWRKIELSTAGPKDSWIASSRCILTHYLKAGIPDERLYLSYYGVAEDACTADRTGLLRRRYGIADSMKIVGNANFIYPPKWYLGQRVGLKAHEDVIDALGLVIKERLDVIGVLIGGAAFGGAWYERRLRERARKAGGERILMTGYLPVEEIHQLWPDFDLAVHVPLSENCGGIEEPMLAGVPVIAGRVGGLPELIIDGLTGRLTPIRQPEELARAILLALDSPADCAQCARNARLMARQTTSTRRSAREILDIYSHVLHRRDMAPCRFDPASCLASENFCEARSGAGRAEISS